MDSKINILITSCGRRVELIKAFVAARKALRVDGTVVAADMSYTAPALYFAEAHEILPKLSASDYVEKLLDVIKRYDIRLVVPTIDTELILLAENRKFLEENSRARILIGETETVKICCDKIRSAAFFSDNGFGCPRTLTRENIEKGDYSFPLFIKPLDGSSSINAFRVNTQRELEFFLEYVPNPIVQECVQGTEYTVDVFSDFDNRLISCVPRRRLQTRSGEILKGQIDLNPTVIEQTSALGRALGIVGHITVQGFMGNDGVFRFIEVNPRFGGGAPMTLKAGANSCEWLYRLLRGEKINAEDVHVCDGMLLSRFDDCVVIEEPHD